METPRYRAFTEIVRGVGARGRTVLKNAGNRRIRTTVLLPSGRAVALDGAVSLFAMPIQSEPSWRRVGYDTAVEKRVAQIRAVEAAGGRFEHAYDYRSAPGARGLSIAIAAALAGWLGVTAMTTLAVQPATDVAAGPPRPLRLPGTKPWSQRVAPIW